MDIQGCFTNMHGILALETSLHLKSAIFYCSCFWLLYYRSRLIK